MCRDPSWFCSRMPHTFTIHIYNASKRFYSVKYFSNNIIYFLSRLFHSILEMSKKSRKKVEKWLREFETPDRNKRFDLKKRSIRRLVDSISDDSASENDQNNDLSDNSDFSDILPSNLSIIGGHNFNRQIELNSSSSVAVQVGSCENISQVEFSFTEGKTLKSRPTQTIPPLVALKKITTKKKKPFRIFEDEPFNHHAD